MIELNLVHPTGVDVTTHADNSTETGEIQFQTEKSIFRAVVNRFGAVSVSYMVTFGAMIMAAGLMAVMDRILKGEVIVLDIFAAAVIVGILAPIISYGFIYLTQQLTEQKMRLLATTDSLTGVLNRRYFFERAQTELERAVRYGSSMSLLILDIDHFKQVNDRFGHQTGDSVLRQLAELAGTSIRSTDLLGRYGGEEFIMLLPETDMESARAVAERMRKEIEEHRFVHDQDSIQITVSVGVSSLNNPDTKLDDLISRADRSLYAAKDAGRNRVGNLPAAD
jgi:diguanylate cyclase (GGDEF)-like protein